MTDDEDLPPIIADDATYVQAAYEDKVRRKNWDYPVFRMLIEGNMSFEKPEGWVPFTPVFRELIQNAYKIAQVRGDNWVGMEHLAAATDHYGRRIRDIDGDLEQET